MKQITIRNDFARVMRFHLEPEGQDFDIPPGKEIAVEFDGGNPVGALSLGESADGCPAASFWTEQGQYLVLVEGRDVWEVIAERGPRDVFER